jgi:preprotein translocase subunit YajC
VFSFFKSINTQSKMTMLSAPSALLAQQPASPTSAAPQMIFLVLMMAAMYFLMIAPQRKKQKEHEKMMAALQSGDEIVTTGGIYGVITNVKDDRFVVRIADNTKIEVGKAFVQSVLKKTEKTAA